MWGDDVDGLDWRTDVMTAVQTQSLGRDLRTIIVSVVTSKGHGTIPREVRRRLGLSTPDRVTFVIADDGIRLTATTLTVTLQSLRGSIPALPGARDDRL